MLSESQRSAALDQELLAVVARGGRVEARMPTSAVVATGKPVNHVLHLLVTVLLFGLWLPVWIIMAIDGGEKRTTVSVDESGNVRRKKGAPAPPGTNWLGRMSENQATLVVIGALVAGCMLVSFIVSLFH